mmetsp:Transcript_20640/g.65875  ORF Transcript_20640/g.65875 Transcript_20640/m.65875 type:complete len:175 (+) Transcript_20640:138-662(+)
MLPLIIEALDMMYGKDGYADEDQKRVLWLTDWHSSRLSYELLKELRAKGVILCGWLPNTTSLCQSPDVVHFGQMKSRMRSIAASARYAGRLLTRIDRIAIAGKAYCQTFDRMNNIKGARRTGMLPPNRNVLLQNPAIEDGDKIQRVAQTVLATREFESDMKITPDSSPEPSSRP